MCVEPLFLFFFFKGFVLFFVFPSIPFVFHCHIYTLKRSLSLSVLKRTYFFFSLFFFSFFFCLFVRFFFFIDPDQNTRTKAHTT